MNRFRTKKKAKEEAAGTARSSSEEQHSFMGFRRNKKAHEEEKKEIDIGSVLPPSDDFRTSLLMTGLSARFSMLREQDDPNTKIGKAADDSVLQPKRQSRLADLGFRGLDDIAEVESIRAAAPFLRTNSFASDTDSGSIMNRTRPTEGNNLFGGRQKIYRIPASGGVAPAKGGGEGGGMGGRALYESDVALSAFQKMRQEKRERFLDFDSTSAAAESQAGGGGGSGADGPSTDPRSDSPSPIDYNLRRETSSTTSSGARNSTAATSVTSQPGMAAAKDWFAQSSSQASGPLSTATNTTNSTVERSTTRIRRLYEQGLNQDLHEQQSSALSRIDTLTGKRMLRSNTPDLASAATAGSGATGPAAPSGLASSASAASLGLHTGTVLSTLERLERRQALAKASAPNLRSISPPASVSGAGSPAVSASGRGDAVGRKISVGPTDGGRAASGAGTGAGAGAGAGPFSGSPPLSPPISDAGGDHAMLAIQPNDVGKATALGMFQKPALPYDESRFAQRQLQLQQGRETPTDRSRETPTGPRSRAGSDAAQATGAGAGVGAGAPTSGLLSRPKAPSVSSNDDRAKSRKTFLFDDDDDDEDENSSNPFAGVPGLPPSRPPVLLQRPSDADHPAFRQPAPPTPLSSSAKSELDHEREPDAAGPAGQPVDSPTLGPASNLSGMVLQHLRSTSNASSVYSMVSPQAPAFDAPASTSQMDTKILGAGDLDLNLSFGRPWDENNWTASVYSAGGADSDKKAATAAPEAVAEPGREAPPPRHTPRKTSPPRRPVPTPAASAPPVVAVPETPKTGASNEADATSAAQSLRSVPSRSRMTGAAAAASGSTGAADREDEDDFVSQLANARRRVQERVQERLTTYAESDSSRNTSPLLAPTEPPTQPPPLLSKAANPLGILRAKSSRGSLMERPRMGGGGGGGGGGAPMGLDMSATQTKAMKMLGIGAATMSTSPVPSKQSFEESALPSTSPISTPLVGATAAAASPSPAMAAAPPAAVPDGFALEPLREEDQQQQQRDEWPRVVRDRSHNYPEAAAAASSTASERSPAVFSSSTTSVPRSSTETEADDADEEADTDLAPASSKADEANMHPGLRAFRNARRQLQKRKELETLARHEAEAAAAASALHGGNGQSPPRERRGTQSSSTPGRERKPAAPYCPSRDPSQESRGSSGDGGGDRSRSASRASTRERMEWPNRTERDRSGSEASQGGYRGAPPRPWNGGNNSSNSNNNNQSFDDFQHASPSGHLGPPGRHGMPLRSPGLPGTDVRRSPHMPPQGLPGAAGGGKLSLQTGLGMSGGGRSPSGHAFGGAASNQPSPLSPLGGGGAGYFPGSGPTTPSTMGPGSGPGGRMQRRPSMPSMAGPPAIPGTASMPSQQVPGGPGPGPSYSTTTSTLNDSLKKTVRKNDISEPTLIMSTSRVPTVSLPQSQSDPDMGPVAAGGSGRLRSGSRARAGSNAAGSGFVAPPVPPINPLRSKPSSGGPRGILGSMMGRRANNGPGGGHHDFDSVAASTPNLLSGHAYSSYAASDHEDSGGVGGGGVRAEAAPPRPMLRKPASEAGGLHARMPMDVPGGMI